MSPTDRWRLVLGGYAGSQLPELGDPDAVRMERALDYLYGREYGGRGARGDGPEGDELAPGSLEASMPQIVDWLHEIRELFPRETVEIVERHALERYGLTELVTDPEVLAKLEPSQDLLKTLLALRGSLDPQVLGEVRRVVRAVVEDLLRRLENEVRRALTGRLSQHRHSPMRIAANFDPRGTIRRNLKHFDPERRQLVVADPRFFERDQRRVPWEIVLCVDQSGSMVGSVIHSAVMAGILAGLPAFRLRLVVFDTDVVDLTEQAADPVEVLMTVQLGGGTDIARAVNYCGALIDNPQRAVFVLITDFCEGGPPSELVKAVRRLASAQVRMIGLASLDEGAHPHYDRAMADRLADVGMHIAALTPSQLAQWLAEVTAR